MDPQLSDWDSDDDKLLDMRTAGIVSFGNIGSYPQSNIWLDVRINPKDLPRYLQPLIKGLSEDLSTREHEQLTTAIYVYKYVFSSSPADMRQTDLITHSIDI